MYKIYLTLVAMISIVSCNKLSEEVCSDNEPVAATFEMASITRALDGVWQSGDKIGLYAYNINGGLYGGYSNIPYTTSSTEEIANFTPADETTIYYPQDGSNLTFKAYSPYSSQITDSVYNVDITNQSTPELIDLITAKSSGDNSKSASSVAFEFSHVLSKMTITLIAGEDMTQEELADVSITINNIPLTTNYNLVDCEFSNIDPLKIGNITPRTITKGVSYDAILIPTNLDDAKVEFAVGDEKFEWKLDGITLLSGKNHPFKVTIFRNSLEVTQSDAGKWEVAEKDEKVEANKLPDFLGDGTVESPYLIYTKDDLERISIKVSKHVTYENIVFRLENDIDLENEEWTPIGTFNSKFSGCFDGNNKTIKGLYISTYNELSGSALFGYLTEYGSVKNLTVEGEVSSYKGCAGIIYNVYPSSENNVAIENCINRVNVTAVGEEKNSIGGVVGSCNRPIVNCINEGNITNPNFSSGGIASSASYIYNCRNYGDVTGGGYNVGGIVGTVSGYNMDLHVVNCYNSGKVSCNVSIANYINTVNIGGIIGNYEANYGRSYIINCYNIGDIHYVKDKMPITVNDHIGGLIGYVTGTIYNKNCYSASTITVDDMNNQHYAGAFIGCSVKEGNSENTAYLYYNSELTPGLAPIGNDVGYPITSKNSSQMQAPEFVNELNSNVSEINSNTTLYNPLYTWHFDQSIGVYPTIDYVNITASRY